MKPEELITRLGADPLEGRIIEGMVGRGCHPREVENTIEARRRGPLQEIPLQAAEQRAIDHIRETAHVTREAAGEILAVLRHEAEAKGRPVGKPDRYVQAFTAEELFTRLGPEALWNDWWWQDR